MAINRRQRATIITTKEGRQWLSTGGREPLSSLLKRGDNGYQQEAESHHQWEETDGQTPPPLATCPEGISVLQGMLLEVKTHGFLSSMNVRELTHPQNALITICVKS